MIKGMMVSIMLEPRCCQGKEEKLVDRDPLICQLSALLVD